MGKRGSWNLQLTSQTGSKEKLKSKRPQSCPQKVTHFLQQGHNPPSLSKQDHQLGTKHWKGQKHRGGLIQITTESDKLSWSWPLLKYILKKMRIGDEDWAGDKDPHASVGLSVPGQEETRGALWAPWSPGQSGSVIIMSKYKAGVWKREKDRMVHVWWRKADPKRWKW